jgi:hypothetical protein
VAFTVFTIAGDPKMNRVPLRNVKERDGRQDTVMMLHPHEIELTDSDTWVVKKTETLRLTRRTKQLVRARVEFPKGRERPRLVCIEPAQLPVEGLLVARALSRLVQPPPNPRSESRVSTVVEPAENQFRRASPHSFVHIVLTNFAREEVVLPKATVVEIAEEISEALVAAINTEKNPHASVRTTTTVNIDPEFRQYVGEKLLTCPRTKGR